VLLRLLLALEEIWTQEQTATMKVGLKTYVSGKFIRIN
jgi:hypothetical protein